MNQNKHNHNPLPRLLSEALSYKDMEGMIKPTIHVDEFDSKMGDDDEIITVSFFVRDRQAAQDLANWFEKGYDWVLDADVSPGEIRPGRYLVFIEMRRRSLAGQHIKDALSDLETLTELSVSDWLMHYDDQETEFSQEAFDRLVPLSPREYRRQKNQDLNPLRSASGIDVKSDYESTPEIKKLQSAAGI